MSLVAPADVRASVDLALQGKRRDLGSSLFPGRFLLATLLVALAILVILLTRRSSPRGRSCRLAAGSS